MILAIFKPIAMIWIMAIFHKYMGLSVTSWYGFPLALTYVALFVLSVRQLFLMLTEKAKYI